MKSILLPKNIFIFIFLVLFPFGQVFRIGVVQPLDVVVALGALYSIITFQKKPDFFKYFNIIIFVFSFTWIFSIFIFNQREVLYGFFYLLRLISYFYFFVYVKNFVSVKENKSLLINSLLSVSVISAFFGWIQFFIFPDLKPLFIWNWDMHLFRLTGLFYDPSFIGLIIVFGLSIAIYKFYENKNKLGMGLIIAFLFISLAFTYSRASYLAFFAALAAIAFYKRLFKPLALLGLTMLLVVLILPTTRNHSIELFRSFSAFARVENYKNTINIFWKSPVFGVGYNNMCLAYRNYIGYQKFSSHACSGSDSSLLFILATTGVTGLTVFMYGLLKIKANLSKNLNYYIFITSFIALVVHSIFSNSLVYPWIMGWILVLLAEA